MVGQRGGARPGAGRPRGTGKSKILMAACPEGTAPLDFLLSLMRDETVDVRIRLQAAKAALPFYAKRDGEAEKFPPVSAEGDNVVSWSQLLGRKTQ